MLAVTPPEFMNATLPFWDDGNRCGLRMHRTVYQPQAAMHIKRCQKVIVSAPGKNRTLLSSMADHDVLDNEKQIIKRVLHDNRLAPVAKALNDVLVSKPV